MTPPSRNGSFVGSAACDTWRIFCSARRRRRKEKNGRNGASFLPLTSVCVVPRETLIARLLRTLAKVARVSSACFPDSSNNPPHQSPHLLPSTGIIEFTWSFVLKPLRHPVLLKLYFSKSLVCLSIENKNTINLSTCCSQHVFCIWRKKVHFFYTIVCLMAQSW